MCGYVRPKKLESLNFLCVCVCVCSVVLLNHSPPSAFVHGISQERKLEWAGISFSSRSSWPRDWTPCCESPAFTGEFFYHWDTNFLSLLVKGTEECVLLKQLCHLISFSFSFSSPSPPLFFHSLLHPRSFLIPHSQARVHSFNINLYLPVTFLGWRETAMNKWEKLLLIF